MVLRKTAGRTLFCALLLLFALSWGTKAYADEIGLSAARWVADAEVQRHIDLYGSWGEEPTARVDSGETVWMAGVAVAHNFTVWPQGHVLVAADDRFSPVLLYSPVSSFEPSRREDPTSIEAWVLPEIDRVMRSLASGSGTGHRAMATAPTAGSAAERITSAWSLYLAPSSTPGRTLAEGGQALPRFSAGTSVGPLLTSSWGQGPYYYNDWIPPVDGSCAHALTGCVATAFAQVMRYWQWPFMGVGGHSYQWDGQTIEADFETPYDWALMPDRLSNASSAAEVDAVAHLMADVAVAVETDFGCNGSSSIRYGDEVLDRFFRYRSGMSRRFRSGYNASEWFGLIQGELDAQPPRPMLFSIFTADWSGHEVVIDGYQSGPTDKVHINLGWSGAYNGYYDITHNFTAAYLWQADYQVLVTGIEPDNRAPQVDAGGDQVIGLGQTVTLTGLAADPDGFTLSQLRWIQRGGPTVALSDSRNLQTRFTAPPVTEETTLTFDLIADDLHGGRGRDSCEIIVYPPQGRPVASAGSDQTVVGGSSVLLSGSAMASEGHEIQSYAWFAPDTADPRAVRLAAEDALQTSFLAPEVTVETDLIFIFEATDTSGQTARDECRIRVLPQAPSIPDDETEAGFGSAGGGAGDRSSGGGPCFIGRLRL